MRGCRLYSLFNKEAVTIILWYVTCVFVHISVFQSVPDNYSVSGNSAIVSVVVYSSIITLYSVLGLFGDVFIGRYRLIQFSLWVQWISVLVSTFTTALLSEYQFHTRLQVLLYLIIYVIEMLGQSTFQVVAIQFGTDQLQEAPSELLSTFIYWYFMIERLSILVYQWILYILYMSLVSSFGVTKTIIIKLGWNLFVAVWVSIMLIVKNYCMLNWFSIRDRMPNDTLNEDPRSGKSNPYHLIYNVLRYAQKHKYPAQRSALTYWEDEIPSRFDLGKSKYGGPFTAEEVENVKTFFHLIKLLLSLSGVLFTLNSVDATFSQYSTSLHFSHGMSDNTKLDLTENLCNTVTVTLLILFYFISPYVRRYLSSMLKRIGIGALFATVCTLSLLLIDSTRHATNFNVPCFFSQSDITLDLSPYLNIIPHLLYELSYMILTISLIEFIIAQSPHSMKGVLIGFYYVLRFGFSGTLTLVEHFAFEKYPIYSNSLSCGTVYYIITIAVALLNLIAYIFVSRKYKLRERDEVINFHIFAEKYYES